MAKVVVAGRLPGRIDEILAGHTVVRPPADEAELPRARLVEELRDAAGLLALLRLRIDDALLDGAPALRVVANYAVGYDNVDLAATRRRGIVVTNTPGVLTDATADLTLALLLAAARRLPEGGAMLRQGRWHGWEPEQLPALTGPDTISALTAPGGRLHEARRAVIEHCAQSEFLDVVAPRGALYAFPSARGEALPDFDDHAFALALLETENVLIVPGSGFNIAESNHFRVTLLPPPAQLREVFARIERCLARMAATCRRHVA